MNEWDYRVDVYRLAVPTRENNPATWPSVRVTHLPTGIVKTDRSTPSELRNKAAAMAAIEQRLATRVSDTNQEKQ